MELQLTSDNVVDVFKSCLFKEGEDTSNAVKVYGILNGAGFNPTKLEENKPKIKELISQLPEGFSEGWTFLNMCQDKHGNQWTSYHLVMEHLMLLGLASGYLEYQFPKEMWTILPGQMPYVITKFETE